MGNINTHTEKLCIKCNTTKSTDDFYSRKNSKDKLTTYCKICFREGYSTAYKSIKKVHNFDFNSVVIENLPFVNEKESISIGLTSLVQKMEVNQSFAVPKSYVQNLRMLLRRDFPELKVKIQSLKDSDFIRAYRLM